MADKDCLIQVDTETAQALEATASDRGLSVSQLLARLAKIEAAPTFVEQEQIDELDRRWERACRAGGTRPHSDVVTWLESWGTTAYEPRRD